MRVFPNINQPWYQAMARFELLRGLYNILLLVLLVGISFAGVNIPIIYLALALLLNISYGCLPYVFMIFATRRNQLGSQTGFNVCLSVSFVCAFLLAWMVIRGLSE